MEANRSKFWMGLGLGSIIGVIAYRFSCSSKGKELKEMIFPLKSAFIIGNEGRGVKESIAKEATDYLHIKMNENCESLNAGVCASIIMYEFRR